MNKSETVLICRPWITVKGKKIYAYKYGKKAFCFNVPKEKTRAGN